MSELLVPVSPAAVLELPSMAPELAVDKEVVMTAMVLDAVKNVAKV